MTDSTRARSLGLGVGAALAAAFLLSISDTTLVAEQAALGQHAQPFGANFRGLSIVPDSLHDFEVVYPTGHLDVVRDAALEALWLGNSQANAINQSSRGDRLAADYASEQLGWPVFCLALPNANLQEQLLLTHWAIQRRHPSVFVLPLVFDDLREDGLRPGLERLATPSTLRALDATEIGRRVAALVRERRSSTESTTRPEHRSLHARLEGFFLTRLDAYSALWRGRSQALALIQFRLYDLRNFVFGIKSTSKRRVIPVRRSRNMRAYAAILAHVRAREIPTLVYVAPLRWDPDPPYDLEAYRAFKLEAKAIADAVGVQFRDFDRLVDTAYWGHVGEDPDFLDFMHFRDAGHRELAAALVAEISNLVPAASN